MKELLKLIIIKILWWQVSRLRAKYKPTVIAVAGSIGKTTTKHAIATVLSQKYKVRFQAGNYNHLVSLPLVFFDQPMPSLLNAFGWLMAFLKNEQELKKYDTEVVVVELGTDHPGDIPAFKEYLKADYGVLTAITPEHMVNFKDLDEVAKEELIIADLVDILFVDGDMVDAKYIKKLKNARVFTIDKGDLAYEPGELIKNQSRKVGFKLVNDVISAEVNVLAKQGLPALAVAAFIAEEFDLDSKEIVSGLQKIQPVPGRMQILKGRNGSTILDDTYNNVGPEGARAALNTLYEFECKQRIAILGQMNELGDFSKKLHEEVGRACDAEKLELLVTIGKEANDYLAPVADKKGCRVVKVLSPYHAGEIVEPLLKKDTIVLVKGSQNKVFAEEAIKVLLANNKDQSKLVRQSDYWMKIKAKQFRDLQ